MIDPEIVVTVAEAAMFFGVPQRTVRTWVARYHVLAVAGRGPRLRQFRLVDLVEAEHRARTSHGGRPPGGR